MRHGRKSLAGILQVLRTKKRWEIGWTSAQAWYVPQTAIPVEKGGPGLDICRACLTGRDDPGRPALRESIALLNHMADNE